MILDLKYYGDAILRKKCIPVEKITDEVRQLAQDLIETVLADDGAGLAAPQVGRSLRIFVVRYDNGMDSEGWPIISPPKLYINPQLSMPSAEMVTHGEGCLSVPGIYEKVTRPRFITVEALDLDGNPFTEEVTDWRGRAAMHENDHLNGVLFVDRVLPKQRKKLDPILKEIKKRYNHPHK